MISRSTLFSIVACSGCLLFACAQEAGGPKPMPGEMPGDFLVRSNYFGAPVSPPGHFDYSIVIDHTLPDSIRFSVGYGPDTLGVTAWLEIFDVIQSDLEDLYYLMLDKDVFRGLWERIEDPPVGASTRHLEILADSQRFTVPEWVEDRTSIAPVYSRIDSLVPAAVWDSLWARRDRYRHRDSP